MAAFVEFHRPRLTGPTPSSTGLFGQTGARVLRAGRLLRPQELGVAAEVGRHPFLVRPRPTVGILATGDELVSIEAKPGPGQIRNSNEMMLAAQAARAGGVPRRLGIAGMSGPNCGPRSSPAWVLTCFCFRGRFRGDARPGAGRIDLARRPQRLSQGAYPSGQTPLVWRLGRCRTGRRQARRTAPLSLACRATRSAAWSVLSSS